MSALAQVLRHRGHTVRGSDRSRDRGENRDLYDRLTAQGVELYPQDGSGVTASVDEVVVSTAVEDSNRDVRSALAKQIPIRRRAGLLASLFNGREGVAVGGTSGKSTVTGMIGQILQGAGRDPTVINGGMMLDARRFPYLGNAVCGDSDRVIIEADESDGTIALYDPEVAVVTNVALDHKPVPELITLFEAFCGRAGKAAVVNLDCPASAALLGANRNVVTFGTARQAGVRATHLAPAEDGIRFRANGTACRLRVPGRHNVSNAAAAIAAVQLLGVSIEAAVDALAGFRGIQRRLQFLGEAAGVSVVDDFAHNPDKIAASLNTLKAIPGRLLVVFQPHGFAPTRLLKAGLIGAFSAGLDGRDLLLMPEIFYAGGTASRDISSSHLVEAISERGVRAEFIPDREAIAERLEATVQPGDRVVVMGARDDTLTEFAQGLLCRFAKERPRRLAGEEGS